mmetsp:Transcript_23410/g.26827  ORF Transcript_23410/g.26827 Transcript_23410/m.26827 type:complete len:112 (-) Transcript_23410:369-704(-)
MLIHLDNSLNVSLSKITVTNSNNTVFYLKHSNVTRIRSLNVRNCSQVFLAKESTVDLLSNSVFTSNGRTAVRFGGVIRMLDSKLTIYNSTFSKSTAQSGAAISFECTGLGL